MIPASEFAARRAAMFSAMEEDSVLILFAGVPKHSSADEDYPFEVNRNFFYLTGVDQEGSVLLLSNTEGEMKEILFVLPFDARKERWYGKRLTPEEASALSGIQNVLLTTAFEGKIDSVLNPKVKEYGEVKKLYLDLEPELKIGEATSTHEFRDKIAFAYGVAIDNAYQLVTTLRLRKSSREIAEMRTAIATTKVGLAAVWAILAAGRKEYELADEFLKTVNDVSGYQGLAFSTIMASGRHGAVLHYPTPLDTIQENDLVLMDLGARSNYYNADITRTLPVAGHFSELQLTVYNIVLGCNKMVASLAKPGLTLEDLNKAATDYLGRECFAKGLIAKYDSPDDINKYYFHHVSHFIGLDTHDPYGDPTNREYLNVPLEPGMVISDEPGLYMAEKGLGIRIEDDLLIKEGGCEVLSRDIIKEPEDLERILASRKK
jgi:Xaa-Pro aminopeptidase